MSGLDRALEAWRDVLGSEHVIADGPGLGAAATATFATTQRIPAIIRPATREQVQACLRIANTCHTPIYPVSTGKNWGYGSRVPARDGCVLMELHRLNRVVDHDEQLGYVTVEPGVTFRRLSELLSERQSELMMSFTGSSMESSLVGNVIERGLGSGPYGDRFGHVCGFEVVLPSGDCIHTGFDRFPHARAARTARWGVGPHTDGLFTQSNLGIVTRMTVWLAPRAKHVLVCWFTIESDDELAPVVDALQRLKFEGVLSAPIQIVNDYKILAEHTQLQSTTADAARLEFLSPQVMTSVRQVFGMGRWNGSFAIHTASEGLATETRRLVEQALAGRVDRLIFVDNTRNGTFDAAAEDDSPIARLTSAAVLRRMPDADRTAPSSVYWRKKSAPPADADPDRDGCGVIWCAPAVPFSSPHILAVVRTIERTLLAHHFEPNIAINCISERSAVVTAALLYDRDVAGEDRRAIACHDELLGKLESDGYLPYRLGIQSMDALPPPRDDYGAFLRTLKRALDSNDILAPGRYDFRSIWPD